VGTTRHRRWLIGYVVLLGVLVLAASLVTTALMGSASYLPIACDYPGRLTGLVTTFVRAVADLSSLVTVGALTSALVAGKARPVRESGSRRQLEIAEWFEPIVVRRAAAVWVISSGLLSRSTRPTRTACRSAGSPARARSGSRCSPATSGGPG